MKQVKGFWLPDHEEHLVEFLEKGPSYANGPTYQLHKLLPAVKLCKQRRRAIDVGAHCGLWSRVLTTMFDSLDAFEPIKDHFDCWTKNLEPYWKGPCKIRLHTFALGDEDKDVSLHTGPSSSGDTYVQDGGEHRAMMKTLDSFNLTDVNFLKIDCEGYEKFVILGGAETIQRDKPVIVVEQKPGKASQFGLDDTEAVALLKGWGAEIERVISGDYIMRWA